MVMIDLSGKTALVTGGAAGIGKACAEILSRAGAAVAIADIDLEGAALVASSLNNTKAFLCDLGKPAGIRDSCSAIVSTLGTPDIIVNCAGLMCGYLRPLQHSRK